MKQENTNQSALGILVQNLSLELYSPSGPLPVLANISFRVPTGQTLALVGLSGCGKTTLLRVLAGVDMNRKVKANITGQITVNGISPQNALKTCITGLLPQTPSLLPWRTVFENVELPFELTAFDALPRDDKARSDRIHDDLKRVGLINFRDSLPIELSGGMQSRLAIVRALARRPKVMLLDEPFGSLDEITRVHLHQEIDALCTEFQCTTVFVTHSVQEAVFLADRVVVLSSRPARVLAEHVVEKKHPREKEFMYSAEFHNLVRSVVGSMDTSFTTGWRV
jgi:NitT/TauT family transport system ATP-binding protein